MKLDKNSNEKAICGNNAKLNQKNESREKKHVLKHTIERIESRWKFGKVLE